MSTGDVEDAVPEYLVTEHNSRISLDWGGVYSGMIPAADGPGIAVSITLNTDYTFEARYRYINRIDDEFFFNGTFSWDDTGGIITLDSGNIHPKYRVGESVLFLLDMAGNRITGDLEEYYILRKELSTLTF